MIENLEQIKTVFDLYMSCVSNSYDLLIDLDILTNFATVNKTLLLKHTTIESAKFDTFALWLKDNALTDEEFVLKYGDRKLSNSVIKELCYLDKQNTEISGGLDIHELSENCLNNVYKRVFIHNIDNWLKKFDAYNLTSYKPLDNYNMEEVRTPDLTETVNNTDSVSDTETGSNTKSVKTDITTTNDSESETGIFGFNSGSTSNPTADGTGSTTVHTTGSANDNTEQTNITGSHTGTKTQLGTKSNTGTETLTRSGNIGVTTSQQMLQSELDLRSHILIDEIYKALAKYMTNPVY